MKYDLMSGQSIYVSKISKLNVFAMIGYLSEIALQGQKHISYRPLVIFLSNLSPRNMATTLANFIAPHPQPNLVFYSTNQPTRANRNRM